MISLGAQLCMCVGLPQSVTYVRVHRTPLIPQFLSTTNQYFPGVLLGTALSRFKWTTSAPSFWEMLPALCLTRTPLRYSYLLGALGCQRQISCCGPAIPCTVLKSDLKTSGNSTKDIRTEVFVRVHLQYGHRSRWNGVVVLSHENWSPQKRSPGTSAAENRSPRTVHSRTIDPPTTVCGTADGPPILTLFLWPYLSYRA